MDEKKTKALRAIVGHSEALLKHATDCQLDFIAYMVKMVRGEALHLLAAASDPPGDSHNEAAICSKLIN